MILAHISDFHLRPDEKEICINKIKIIRECIINQKAQIIVYTGDIVDYRYIGSDEKRKKNPFNLLLNLLEFCFLDII